MKNDDMHKILMNCSNYKTDDLVKKFEKDGATIVIFGCGVEGKLVLHVMLSRGIKVDYFIDSNKKLQGKYFQGIKTISAEELVKLSPDAHIFIAHKWLTVALEILNKLNF